GRRDSDRREYGGDRVAARFEAEEIHLVAVKARGPATPEGLREERDLDPIDLVELGAPERVELNRILARLAQVDRGPNAVTEHRRAAVRGESAKVVGSDQRVTTGGPAAAGGEAAKIANVQARIPVELARIGGHR